MIRPKTCSTVSVPFLLSVYFQIGCNVTVQSKSHSTTINKKLGTHAFLFVASFHQWLLDKICNKHNNVYIYFVCFILSCFFVRLFVLLEEDEEEEEEVRGKMFPFDKVIIPGKSKYLSKVIFKGISFVPRQSLWSRFFSPQEQSQKIYLKPNIPSEKCVAGK